MQPRDQPQKHPQQDPRLGAQRHRVGETVEQMGQQPAAQAEGERASEGGVNSEQ